MSLLYSIGHPILLFFQLVLSRSTADKSVDLIQLIELPKIIDDASLVFGQTPNHIPFTIKRIYYIYDAKPYLARGKHAHHHTQQILFCLKGKVRMLLDNGYQKREVTLSKPNVGIYLDKLVWHEMHDMTSNTLLLVLASDIYKPKDYIRDYEEFKKITDPDEH